MERNNCTKRPVEETTTATKIATGNKTMTEILNLASDMVPGATAPTFNGVVDAIKDLDKNTAIYFAEMQNRNFDVKVAIEALQRIQSAEEVAKEIAEKEAAREKEWMGIGSGKIWMPVYSYCKAISSSAYTDPIKNMAKAIMGALTASTDKVATPTVLSIKLTQAYAAANDTDSFIRQLDTIREYMNTIILANDKKDGGNNGYYWLQDIEYAIVTWIDTIKPIIK